MERRGRGIGTTAMDRQAEITSDLWEERDDLEVLLGGRAAEEVKKRRAGTALGDHQ